MLVVLHAGTMSGPARNFRPRLAALEDVSSTVILPEDGAAARFYADVAIVRTLDYARLVVPRRPVAVLGALRDQLKSVAVMRRALKDSNAEVLLTVTTVVPAAVIAARLQRKTILVYCGELLTGRGGARGLVDCVLVLILTRTADGIMTCSELAAEPFRRAGGKARITTLYPGIEPSDFADGDREAGRAALGLAAGAGPVVLSVGNVTPARGQDVLIEAMAPLRRTFPEAVCVIAGAAHTPADRQFADRLERLAKSTGPGEAVRFVGQVDDLRDTFAAADVVVNPCRFDEPFGRVAFEAICAGRPVVSSRTGAVTELLEHGVSALLVPPERPAELASAIGEVLTKEDLARSLVTGGRKIVDDVLLAGTQTERFVTFFENVRESSLAAGSRRSDSPTRERGLRVLVLDDGSCPVDVVEKAGIAIDRLPLKPLRRLGAAGLLRALVRELPSFRPHLVDVRSSDARTALVGRLAAWYWGLPSVRLGKDYSAESSPGEVDRAYLNTINAAYGAPQVRG